MARCVWTNSARSVSGPQHTHPELAPHLEHLSRSLPPAAWLTCCWLLLPCDLPTGDRPTDVSQRRLATSITAASGGRLLAAIALLVSGITAAATHSLADVEAAAAAATGSAAAGDAGIVAAAAAGALALVWPVLGPFVEVWRFSQLSGAEVEAAVAINEPLQVREK